MTTISIDVLAAMSGDISETHSVNGSSLGHELLRLIMQPRAPRGFGTARLLHKDHAVRMHTSLVAQGITDGSQLTLVLLHVTDRQQNDLVYRMHMGEVFDNEDDIAIFNTILSLDWHKHDLANLTLPNGLESLTFGLRFNQSLPNTTLPSSLQSLTFGDTFNQSLDNTTLPSGLQDLDFGTCFNQRLDRTTLPSGRQSLTVGCFSTRAWTTRLCQAAFRT